MKRKFLVSYLAPNIREAASQTMVSIPENTPSTKLPFAIMDALVEEDGGLDGPIDIVLINFWEVDCEA